MVGRGERMRSLGTSTLTLYITTLPPTITSTIHPINILHFVHKMAKAVFQLFPPSTEDVSKTLLL